MNTNIHSIWVEDEQTSKFHLNDPNLKIINSQVPILSNKKHIDLPPLPPTSFFSHTNAYEYEQTEKKNKFIKAFKKLLSDDASDRSSSGSGSSSTTPKKQLRRKISTPFGFNHISHIDNQTEITVTQLNQFPQQSSTSSSSQGQVEIITSKDSSKRVSTSARAFCTSPQINAVSTNTTASMKPIPRSQSNATSLSTSRSSSTQLFTRSGSISTMATTISSKTHSKKPSLITTSMIPAVSSYPTQPQHQHQDSSSSIENLKKLEKNQIQKQSSIDYSSSNFKFPLNSTPEKSSSANNNHHHNSINWGTPDPQSVSRQSWVYEEPQYSPDASPKTKSSPRSFQSKNLPMIPSTSSSPYNMQGFTSQLDDSFTATQDLSKIIHSIDDFTKFFKSSENPEDDEDNLNETIASIRAARASRMSRLEDYPNYQNDPRYLSFIEDFEKIKTNSTSESTSNVNSQRSSGNSGLSTIPSHEFERVEEVDVEYSSEETEEEEEQLVAQQEVGLGLESLREEEDDSSIEGTPKQVLLPSIL